MVFNNNSEISYEFHIYLIELQMVYIIFNGLMDVLYKEMAPIPKGIEAFHICFTEYENYEEFGKALEKFLFLFDINFSLDLEFLHFSHSGDNIYTRKTLIFSLYKFVTKKLFTKYDNKESDLNNYIYIFHHLIPLFTEFNLIFSDYIILIFLKRNFISNCSFQLLSILNSITQCYTGSVYVQINIFPPTLDPFIQFCYLDQISIKQFLKIIRNIFEHGAQLSSAVTSIRTLYHRTFLNVINDEVYQRYIKQNQIFKIFLLAKIHIFDEIPVQNSINLCFLSIQHSYKCLLNFLILFKNHDGEFFNHLIFTFDMLYNYQVADNYQYKWFLLIKINLRKIMEDYAYLTTTLNHFYGQAPINYKKKIKNWIKKNNLYVILFETKLDWIED